MGGRNDLAAGDPAGLPFLKDTEKFFPLSEFWTIGSGAFHGLDFFGLGSLLFAGRVSEQGESQVEIKTNCPGIFFQNIWKYIIGSEHKCSEPESKSQLRINEPVQGEGHRNLYLSNFISWSNR